MSTEQRRTSAALLWLLKGHAAQRAIAAWHAGWQPARDTSGGGWLAPHLAITSTSACGKPARRCQPRPMIFPRLARTAPTRGLGDVSPRARLARRASTRWNRLPGNADDAAGDAVLIDPDRQLMETAIQALLKNRDDRPVTIKE